VELDANVSERDARVRERESTNARLYNVLTQPHDERVSLVGLELSGMLCEGSLELRKGAGPHSLNEDEQSGRIHKDGCLPLTTSKYALRDFSRTGCLNRLLSGISPINNSTTTKSLCTAW
jgi:hypothetical protein